MLTISKPLSAGQAQAYHKEEFANAQENYYSEGDRIRGEWHGQLAEQWGLKGEVNEEHFERLASGQHPITGEPTGAPPNRARIRKSPRRDGAHDGTPRRLGCNVLRA